jgi:uncharacterized protein YjiK
MFFDSCGRKSVDSQLIYEVGTDYQFPYDITNADKEYELKGELREISGLTYYNDHSVLCVNDEKGIIYKYNLKKEEITKKYKFARRGDYEGIEMFGKQVCVLRSDGTLFFIDKLEKETSFVKKLNLLHARNNTEGLGFDAKNNSLLIACKGAPGKGKSYKGQRAIYRYSLETNKLSETPDYLIDQEQIRTILRFNGYSKFSVKLLESINPSEGDATFQPSAVAVHPLSNNLYVLASVGKLLIVLSPEGEILALVKLQRKQFQQPEGICFSPDGTLFISNEGRGKAASIYKFKYTN